MCLGGPQSTPKLSSTLQGNEILTKNFLTSIIPQNFMTLALMENIFTFYKQLGL